MIEQLLEAARNQIHSAQRIQVISHIRPDGDAVGSALGLGLALQQAGKDVQIVLADGIPSSLKHLPGSEQIRSRAEGEVDLTIVVDCSDLARLGNALEEGKIPDINIDHHPTNQNFGRINIVVPEATATAELLAEYLPALGLSLSPEAAASFLTGLITDTLGFRTSNMTPKALRIAADLTETGIDLPELYQRSLTRRSFEALKYWGFGLENLKRKGKLIWTSLSAAERSAANYSGRDDADLINILSSVHQTEIVVVFVEQGKGTVKVSWRSLPGIDVSAVAVAFGGGGHKVAAGAEIAGSLEEVQAKVLEATLGLFDKN